MSSDYYVYVYIDPRNFEEFYFGKGTGARKDAHLQDHSDTQKAHRIEAIRKAGLEPTIRIIARDLSEHDALLVEKTLLWKLGKNLTNISSGHYKDNFRPHDTRIHKYDGCGTRPRTVLVRYVDSDFRPALACYFSFPEATLLRDSEFLRQCRENSPDASDEFKYFGHRL